MTDQTRARKARSRGAANDDFKRSFPSWFWGSMIAATMVHFLAFATWPEMSVAVVPPDDDVIRVSPAPDVPIPEPPAPIERPVTPVFTREIGDEFTIPDVTFDNYLPATLPPPPDNVEKASPDAPRWTPVDVLPYIRNRDEITRALTREYPPLLRDAGIGGTTRVWFHVDETGKVIRTQVHTSSGHKPLDEAALRIAPLYEFAPALNRDRPVAVWVSLDVTFRPR